MPLFSDTGILAQENLASKISQEPLELGSWNFAGNQGSLCRWPDWFLVKFCK